MTRLEKSIERCGTIVNDIFGGECPSPRISFRDVLKEYAQAVLEEKIGEVEKMKYQQPLLGTSEPTERVIMAVNQAITDVIKLLKT